VNELLKSKSGPEIAHLSVKFLGRHTFKQFLHKDKQIEFKAGADAVFQVNTNSQQQDLECHLNSKGANYTRFRFYVDVEPGDNILRIYGADYWNGWAYVYMGPLSKEGLIRTNSYLTYKSDKKKKVAIYANFHSNYNSDFRLYMTSNGVERQLHCEDQMSIGYGWNMGLAITMVSNYSGGWRDRETLDDVPTLLHRHKQFKNRVNIVDNEEQLDFTLTEREESIVRMAGYIIIPEDFKIRLRVDVAMGTLIAIGDETYAWKNNSSWYPWVGKIIDLSDKKPGEVIKITALMSGSKHSGRRIPIRIQTSEDGVVYSERVAFPGVMFHKDEQMIKPVLMENLISSTNVIMSEIRFPDSRSNRLSEIVLDARGYDIFGCWIELSSDDRNVKDRTMKLISVIDGIETEVADIKKGNYSVGLPTGTEQVIIRSEYTGRYSGYGTHFKAMGLYKSKEWEQYINAVTPKTDIVNFTNI
jgi:hypothetical protein